MLFTGTNLSPYLLECVTKMCGWILMALQSVTNLANEWNACVWK